jgi:hypothetical protein
VQLRRGVLTERPRFHQGDSASRSTASKREPEGRATGSRPRRSRWPSDGLRRRAPPAG